MSGAIVLGAVIVLVLLGLLALARHRSEQTWTPERYEKERKGGTALGNALLAGQAALEPGAQHALEHRMFEDVDDEASGDPPVPGPPDDEP